MLAAHRGRAGCRRRYTLACWTTHEPCYQTRRNHEWTRMILSYSGSFVACRAVGFAKADPFAVCSETGFICRQSTEPNLALEHF
jgi:hypothetical protein